jgi:putative tryptophan/tyrosine transport system substrate-binding protein
MQTRVSRGRILVRRTRGGSARDAIPLAVEAQPAGKPWRIGYLPSSSAERERTRVAAFQQGLRELGYLEGKSILIEPRYAGGEFEKLPELAAGLARLKVDVFVVAGAPAAHAAKKASTVIPIVMTAVADPVGMGLVASLARPGGSITGLSDFNTGVVVKRLELLREVAPSVSRVAVLLNPTNPSNSPQMKLTQAAAATLALTLLAFEAKRADEIDRAFLAMKTERPGALIVIGDPLLGTHAKRIVELSTRNRLPAIYWTREFPDAGGLMSYGTNMEGLWRQAATYVDKILKGAKPSDLPVEQPTTFELVINLKAAKALGITIPHSLLLRADQVIDE